MLKGMKSKVAVSGALFSLCIVSACGSGESGNGKDGEKFSLTAPSQSNPTGFSQWLADELGYFDEVDLDVEIEYADTGAALLASGAADDWQAGWIGSPPLITGYDQWGLLPAGTMLTENKNIILFMDKDALEGSDPAEVLKSKEVGVTANSVSEQLLFACAEHLGVDPDEVNTVPLDPPAIVNGMLNDDIQAAVTFSAVDWPLVEESDQYEQVCDGDDAGVLLSDPLVVTPTFWDEHPDEAARFVAAMYRANDYILQASDEEITPYLMDYLGEIGADFPEEAAQYSLSVRTPLTLDEALEQMESGEFGDGIKETAEYLVGAGVHDQVPDVDAMSEEGTAILKAAKEYYE